MVAGSAAFPLHSPDFIAYLDSTPDYRPNRLNAKHGRSTQPPPKPTPDAKRKNDRTDDRAPASKRRTDKRQTACTDTDQTRTDPRQTTCTDKSC
jgi:hypothetical protein